MKTDYKIAYENVLTANKMLEKEIERLKEVINTMDKEIDDLCKNQKKEIERLNNKLKDIKSQLDYLETYSSKEDVFEDMKRRLDRIESIVNRK